MQMGKHFILAYLTVISNGFVCFAVLILEMIRWTNLSRCLHNIVFKENETSAFKILILNCLVIFVMQWSYHTNDLWIDTCELLEFLGVTLLKYNWLVMHTIIPYYLLDHQIHWFLPMLSISILSIRYPNKALFIF